MTEEKIESDGETTTYSLTSWGKRIDQLLDTEQPEDALRLIRIVLHQLPRHLPTYQRLLQVIWQLRRWDEGINWGMRLLRADPGNPVAWSAVAMGVEQQGDRVQARSIWQRAFEADPYQPEIRAGLSRTTLREPEPLILNPACLATIYLRCGRWEQAAAEYDLLISVNSQRNDFLMGKLATLWRRGRRSAAYQLARHLLDKEKNLILPWLVLNDLGDVNDKALAYNPIQMMDPDGEYIFTWLGLGTVDSSREITLKKAEVELLKRMG